MYTSHKTIVSKDGNVSVEKSEYKIGVDAKSNKLGVMLVGLGGNNGTTFTAGILAAKKQIRWETKEGEQKVEFLGSISQVGSIPVGYDSDGKLHSKLFKDVVPMHDPTSVVVGGWDICKDDLYTAAKKAKVLEPSLLTQLKEEMENIHPLPSIFDPTFIASNQITRANNIISRDMSTREKVFAVKEDIRRFRSENNLDKVIVLWTASTEKFNSSKWETADHLLDAIAHQDSGIPPSIMFAIAAIETGCIYLNGSPQNTLGPAVIDLARRYNTHIGGDDFKTGQTKIKSALVDWLVSSGIRPLSIVSYNHLGNNDGKNLSEEAQFRSKEITKKNVIDDVIENNPELFKERTPDHAVVIKYVPAVGDSKRAMDEYYSELFLGGKHTLAIHNTCEDSLLAVPLMLDLVIFADLFSRVSVRSLKDDVNHRLNPVLSCLSLFFKAPVVNDGEPLINAFFKQRHGLENFFRVLANLPPLDHITLPC